MRNEDASQSGLNQSAAINARDDADHLAEADFGPATGNAITGVGTMTGSTGTDMLGDGGRIVAIEGAGGSDNSFSAGKLEVQGQYGTLTIDADGNYSYVRNAGTPAGVSDVFTYTVQAGSGSDTAKLVINIGDVPMLATQGSQTVQTADGVVVLPPGVELSDVRVVGRDLVVTLPDGSTMVIADGAIFVPQLVIDGVQVPASNLAALLIDAEPKPAAGDLSPQQQSSGGNFALPPPPLDPGVPLGDLLPPTVLDYTPPTFEEVNNAVEDDNDPVAGAASIQLDDDDVPGAGGNAGGPNDDAGSANAAGGGFLPGSDGDGPLEWALLASGAPSGFTYELQPDGSIEVIQAQDGSDVVVLTITVNPATGAYTVVENNPVRHAPGDTENNTDFVINYSVTDDDGDVAIGSLTINVDDDTPVVTVSAGSDANVLLTTDDFQTIGANSDTAVSLADFSGVFGSSTVLPGADGAGPASTTTYVLAVTSLDSGLKSHGAQINLYVFNGTVVGTTGGAPASLADPSIVFTVAVNGSGVVTLTQLQQIDHPIASDPTPSGTPFIDHIVSMTDTFVTLTRSTTVVDNDGDSVTGSATVNIGANLRFTDDGPTIDPSLNREVEAAIVDESAPVDPAAIPLADGYTAGDDPHLDGGLAIGKGSTSGAVIDANESYGADGPGAVTYALDVLNSVSGLTTTEGVAINLVELTNGVVVGVVNGTTTVAFAIQIDPSSGIVTVEQYLSIHHPDSPNNYNEFLTLNEGSLGVTVTATDFDGDTATSPAVDITPLIHFHDDGPSVTPDEEFVTPDLVVDESPVGLDPFGDSDPVGVRSASASFAGAFGDGIFGADGPLGGTVDGGTTYALLLSDEGIGSGIYALDPTDTVATPGDGIGQGAEILLFTAVDGSIEGRTGGPGGTLYFTISVNDDGLVTFTQEEGPNVWHANTGSHDDTSSLILDGEGETFSLQVTVTDGDEDVATASIDLSNGIFQIEDDGPSIPQVTPQGVINLVVDESPVDQDEGGDNAPPGVRTASLDLSGLFGSGNFGTDGPLGANADLGSSFGLVLSSEGANSGLYALDPTDTVATPGDGIGQGEQIQLFTAADGSIEGRVGGPAGTLYFTISVTDDGLVTFTQEEGPNVWHADTGSDDDTSALVAAPGTVNLVLTITDADGDSRSGSLDLSDGVFQIEDDGPTVDVIKGSLPTDPQALAAFQLITQDHGTEGAGSTIDSTTADFSGLFSLNKDAGTDGEQSSSLTYDLDVVGDVGGNGIDSGLDSHGNTIFLYQIDSNTIIGSTSAVPVGVGHASVVFQLTTTNAGVVTLTQYQQIDHPAGTDPDGTDAPFDDHIVSLVSGKINLIASGTITDNDGDTDTDTETLDLGGLVGFRDDGPTADNEGNIATVDDSATNLNIGNVSTLLNGDDYHADGPAAVGAITIAVGNQGGTVTIDGSGNLLYTAAADASGGNVVETFTYTITDFDGDTASGTFTVTLTDDGATVGTTSFSVDEEGIAPNGIPGTVYLDGSDLPGASATASGTLSGIDFGDDGAGTIVLAASADTGLRTIANQIVKSSWDPATLTLTGFVDLDANGLDAGDITVFTLQITDVPTGAYSFALLQPVKHATADTEDDVLLSVGVTVEDSEGDGQSSTIEITIDDDSPQLTGIAGGGSVTLDETTAVTPAGFPINASSLTAVITATKAFGADGPAAVGDTVYGLTLANGSSIGTTLASGLQTAIGDLPITLTLTSATVITGTYNGGANTAFTITMNPNGTITVVQNVPLEHLVDGPPGPAHDDSLDLVLDGGALTNLINATITIKDGDGDTHTGSTPIGDQIIFKDDGPTLNVTKGADAGVTLTTDDADTVGTDTDTSTPTAINFGGVFGLSSTTGADGASAPSLNFALDVTGYVDGPTAAGVDSGLDQGNNNIYLYEISGKVVGSTAAAKDLVTVGNTVFDVAVSATGVVTLTQYSQIDHETVDPTPTGSPFADHIASLADGLVTLTASASITDNDGDTASDSETVEIGANLRFTDDGPDVVAVVNTNASVTLDESLPTDPTTITLVGVTKGNDPGHVDTDGIAIGRAVSSGSVLNLTTEDYGADGAAPNPDDAVYTLTVNNAASGLTTTEGHSITLVSQQNGTVVVGIVDAGPFIGQAAFAIAINPETGVITVEQYLSLTHPTAGDNNEPVSMTAGHISANVTIEDFDGDTDSDTGNDISGLITFLDDGPVITTVTDPLNIANVGTPTGMGNFVFDVGADDNADFDDITVSGFTVRVNGVLVPADDVDFFPNTDALGNPAPETADTATYAFSFTYSVGPGSPPATATGTLVFYKTGPNAGKYEVTLDSGPIQGFTLADTGSAGVDAFDPYDAPGQEGGSPEIQTVQIADDLFIQFTSGSVPQNGTFQTSDFLSIDPPPDAEVPADPNQQWVEGDLFIDNNATFGTVTASNTAIGANSNTLQYEEVIEFNLYASDPGGVPNTDPTTSAGEMFVQFDLISDVDDLIVILKLVDTVTGEFTTKAIVVDAADLYRGNSAADEAFLAGTIYSDFSDMGNNEALLIIQENDYNAPGENWEIVGGQILTGETNVSGTGINLVRGLGDSGGSSATQAFSTDTDSGSAKIMSIGFAIPSTTAQSATIEFDVTVTDGDGDTAVQNDITVNIGTPPPPPPVVLDMDGDGAEFLDRSAGVAYDYGAGLVSTAWVGADDAILVRDANGDGTVTDASEFVFGGNGVTDMEALHAQYGDQLDASDADFTMFALWTDANSNGVVDAGEMQSLAEAGVASIGLVSDGNAYEAAGGDVLVAGTSSYTRTDGSTGEAVDAAFTTGGLLRNQEVERVAANSNTTVLAAAVAAAGMAATSAAASDGSSSIAEAPQHSALHSIEPLSVAGDLAASTSIQALISGTAEAAAMVALPAGLTAWSDSHWSGPIDGLGEHGAFDAGFGALSQGTDVIASQMAMPTIAAEVAMPSAEMMAGLDRGPVQSIDTVEQILVDALQGGGANPVDTILNGLQTGEIGGIAVMDSAASGFQAGVPTWDMGAGAGFTVAMPNVITMETQMLHHDAIQPAANG